MATVLEDGLVHAPRAGRKSPLRAVEKQEEQAGPRIKSGVTEQAVVSMIPLSRLVLAADNVRRGSKGDLDQLAADILAHGLLQNLVGVIGPEEEEEEAWPRLKAGVTPAFAGAGERDVLIVAGGRRLRALQLLARQKKIATDFMVPVRIEEAGAAREASLAENYQRLAMNPGEEAEAFARLVDAGLSEADTATRFGVTVLHVRQRLRLAGLAPAVLDALKAGKMTLDQAKAFASTADQARQAEVFKGINWAQQDYAARPEGIRNMLARHSLRATDAKARFVGRAAYAAAGGAFETDLFAAAEDELWTDLDLVNRLFADAMAAEAERLRALHGFAAVIPEITWAQFSAALGDRVSHDRRNFDFTQEPEDVRAQLIVKLELGDDGVAEIDDWLAWLNDASVPVVLSPGPDDEGGEDDLEDGLDDGEGDSGVETPAPNPSLSEGGESGKPLAASLQDALAMRRRDALALALIGDTERARDFALFCLCETMGKRTSAPGSTILCGDGQDPSGQVTVKGDALALALAAAKSPDAYDDSWRTLKSAADRWEAFIALPVEQRLHWGAVATAASLTPFGDGYRHTYAPLTEALAASLGTADAKAALWRPTADNYFGRAGKARCVAFLDDVFDGLADSATWAKWKKDSLASACEALAAGNGDKLGISGGKAEIEARALAWLPAEMRFAPIALEQAQ